MCIGCWKAGGETKFIGNQNGQRMQWHAANRTHNNK